MGLLVHGIGLLVHLQLLFLDMKILMAGASIAL